VSLFIDFQLQFCNLNVSLAFGLQVSNLRPFLEKDEIDNEIREKLLRNTKMIFYLCTELMYKFEEKAISEKETSQKLAKVCKMSF